MVIKDKIFTVMIKAPKQVLVSLIHSERDELKADVKETSPSPVLTPRAMAAVLCDSEHTDIRQSSSHIKHHQSLPFTEGLF